MRRLAVIAILLLGAAAWLAVATAGADDTHTYEIELDDAFGLVQDSDVRIAGVNVGKVTDLDINADKKAVVSIETSGTLGVLGEDSTCSTEPQSLIAEYFIDCEPEGDPLPEGGQIPVEQTTQTVQPDLVQNTLREPFRARLQLLINEFGTALAGNPEDLNAAIRRGAPALRELQATLDILADQNRIITNLNQDSDAIITKLAERREDVVRFIQEARDTAAASAERRGDLSRDFEILDDFLAELRPTLADLETLADTQTPLLRDLNASAPGLNRLAVTLPAFNRAATTSLHSLGEAGVIGRRALRKGHDEIRQLGETAKNAFPVAELLKDFLADMLDPRRAVEIDRRAGRDTGRTSTRPGTRNTMGYTAIEGLLNYAYYQTGAINQFDQVSHLLHFTLYDVETGPCSEFKSGRDPETGETGVPSKGGGTTTAFSRIDPCVAWLGPNQPGITQGLNLPPYDPSVCPEGTEPPAAESLCSPSGSAAATTSTRAARSSSSSATRSGTSGSGALQPGSAGTESGGSGGGLGLPQLPDGSLPGGGSGGQGGLEDALPPGTSPEDLQQGIEGANGASGQASEQLLNFLFGS